ncbi:MAG: hypothetical protein ACJ764_03185 [Solirubrobacteraceae bacterium]
MAPSLIWKVVLAAVLGATILASAFVRPPRKSFPRDDLRLMVTGALALYCVGLIASVSHHEDLAALLYVSGIGISTFAVWLSRGSEPGWPRPDDSSDEPPDDPEPAPEFDWDAFERELGVYAERRERERIRELVR